MIGQTLAHYKILEKIGSGGMGDVYLAEDTKLDRKVALKVLPPELAESEMRRARFQREAKAIAALNHPNIVHVYSVEEVEGVHFITMELVQGKTLTELIPKKGLALNKFFELAIPLADAVSAAHQKGIIHRDLKPDNLMQDEERRLKILDFGLAKWRQELLEAGLSELPTLEATGEGRIVGTLNYMSPEQAEGKTVDHRSDIFSIGIILYEMATGQRPFTGQTAASVLSSIIKETPPSITEVNPALPKSLWRITRRCLAKDTERRYQSAKEIRNELEELTGELASGELVEGAVVPMRSPVVKWFAAAAVTLALALVGALGYFLREASSARLRFTNPIQITSAVGVEDFPTWSPGGERLAFQSDESGNNDIWVAQLGGGGALNLTVARVEEDRSPRCLGAQLAISVHNCPLLTDSRFPMSIFKRTQRKYVKKAYRVRNWREYEAGLRNRGSLTVWISLTAGKLVNWDAPRPRRRKPGRQRKYSNHAIETAVTLGMVFHLSSRQSEGLLRSLFALMKLDNDVPDHTTISRRKAKLGKVPFYQDKQKTPLHILIDSSGLAVHAGQLRRAPKSRDYRKLHLCVDEQSGEVVAGELTSKRARDSSLVASLVGQIDS